MKGEASDISSRSRSVSLCTVTRFTETVLDIGCLSLQTRPIIVQPNLYCSAQGSSSFPEITFIGWKAAGTFRPMSSPISTSGEEFCLRCGTSVSTGWLHRVWQCPRVMLGCTLSSKRTGLYWVRALFLRLECKSQLLFLF